MRPPEGERLIGGKVRVRSRRVHREARHRSLRDFTVDTAGLRWEGSRGSRRRVVSAGSPLSPEEAGFLVRQRVARLATADAKGRPQSIPVCFAYEPGTVFIALDEKPKGVGAKKLKRVRNILENPEVSLVADRYDDSDWSRLAFVMVRGEAELLEPGDDGHEAAIQLLRGKYRQYERMRIEENPVIAIRVERASSWGALSAGEPDAPRLEDSLFGRRSVRKYLDREVPDDHIERVLEAARWAPSPHGRQPWRFAVLKKVVTKERLADAMGEAWRENLEMDGQPSEVVEKRLEGSRRRLLDAPVLVLACLYLEDLDEYPDEGRQRDEETMAVQSLGAAIQNMLLAAYGLGLDTSWMCAPLFTPRTVARSLDLDERLIPHALITLGYASGDSPKRRSRRPLEELVVFRDE
ncbi:MAG: TIGR03668 family PPOX class F420-dependent oxidoreductase [Rubrobacter sp.]|nr:TIGR03668 family PPOX class F420-dependent oxidoreductase [Rubrobacter sp.]